MAVVAIKFPTIEDGYATADALRAVAGDAPPTQRFLLEDLAGQIEERLKPSPDELPALLQTFVDAPDPQSAFDRIEELAQRLIGRKRGRGRSGG